MQKYLYTEKRLDLIRSEAKTNVTRNFEVLIKLMPMLSQAKFCAYRIKCRNSKFEKDF